jgi:addiction module HigA family antidote
MLKSSIIISEGTVMKIVKTLPPMHPGEMLRQEFLQPLGLTPYAVAKACGIPRTRIERIVREELGISADTALRLAKLFGTSAEFWLNLQTRYEMLIAQRAIAKDLKRIEPLKRAAA